MRKFESNKENMRKWVDALRSGEFQQGSGRLSVDGTYCCLGVACEVAIREGVPVEKTRVGASGQYKKVYRYDETALFLPVAVQDWLGLSSVEPTVLYDCTDDDCTPSDDGTHSVVSLNDSEMQPFEVIADALERTYLKPAEAPA